MNYRKETNVADMQKLIGGEPLGTTARPWGIRERLESQKADLEARLARVNIALTALDNQPAVAEALEAVMKAL